MKMKVWITYFRFNYAIYTLTAYIVFAVGITVVFSEFNVFHCQCTSSALDLFLTGWVQRNGMMKLLIVWKWNCE